MVFGSRVGNAARMGIEIGTQCFGEKGGERVTVINNIGLKWCGFWWGTANMLFSSSGGEGG